MHGERATALVELVGGDLAHGEPAVSTWNYVGSSQFWFESFQNWESEFLAVASMAAFAIFVRERGSPESKIVGAAHEATAQDS